MNIEHWLWHVAHYWVDMWTFKKIKKIKKNPRKPRSDTWQLLCMTINDLNGVNKKELNWIKLTKIETKKYFNLVYFENVGECGDAFLYEIVFIFIHASPIISSHSCVLFFFFYAFSFWICLKISSLLKAVSLHSLCHFQCNV